MYDLLIFKLYIRSNEYAERSSPFSVGWLVRYRFKHEQQLQASMLNPNRVKRHNLSASTADSLVPVWTGVRDQVMLTWPHDLILKVQGALMLNKTWCLLCSNLARQNTSLPSSHSILPPAKPWLGAPAPWTSVPRRFTPTPTPEILFNKKLPWCPSPKRLTSGAFVAATTLHYDAGRTWSTDYRKLWGPLVARPPAFDLDH